MTWELPHVAQTRNQIGPAGRPNREPELVELAQINVEEKLLELEAARDEAAVSPGRRHAAAEIETGHARSATGRNSARNGQVRDSRPKVSALPNGELAAAIACTPVNVSGLTVPSGLVLPKFSSRRSRAAEAQQQLFESAPDRDPARLTIAFSHQESTESSEMPHKFIDRVNWTPA